MLCAVIKGPSPAEIRQQLKAAATGAQLVEWRLDCFSTLESSLLAELKRDFPLPAIFTLRPLSQGGHFEGDEETRLAHLERLAALSPDYIDLEYTVPSAFFEALKARYPHIKLIASYHDFEKTPLPLEAVAEALRPLPADFYKMAVLAQSATDTLQALLFARQADTRYLVMTMGETGPLSRILAPVMGRPFTYASLHAEQTTAPGQMTVEELQKTYHYATLNPSTQLYGLIGNPIAKSPSDKTHNAAMQQLHLDSLYVKIPVRADELPLFIDLAKRLGFCGLSVTMPLKEQILPLLDEIDERARAIGAVNTLHFVQGKVKGYNTDSTGALDALEKHCPVKGKKLVLLGAGGAGRAIVWEAMQRGAQVVVLNRDPTKARQLAKEFGCMGGGFEDFATLAQDYAIIINGTPHPLPIDPAFLRPYTVAMDLTSQPKETLFLREAKARHCTLVFGIEMFLYQAIEQFKLWFPQANPHDIENAIQQTVAYHQSDR